LYGLAGPALAQNQWVEPAQPAPMLNERPGGSYHARLCSDRLAVCVHATEPSFAKPLPHTLSILEKAYQNVVFVLNWRAPMKEGLPAASGFDVYLVGEGPTWSVRPDPPKDNTTLARSTAFGLLRYDALDTCATEFALAAAVARAGIYAIDAAANDELANATATYIASLVVSCPSAFIAGLDDFQASPYLAVSNPIHDQGRGALLFPWFIQTTYGSGNPADLLHALWALSSQPYPKDSGILLNEPDFLDTMSTLAADTRRSPSDLWLDFAVARAFVGNRDNGAYLPDTRFVGSAGAVRFEWSVSFSSLPRRFAPRYPVEPTGSSYLWLSLDSPSPHAGLGFRADWEQPDRFRFALVLVDEQGQTLSRFNPMTEERGTSVEANIETLTGAKGILVVATNTGSVLQDIAFDPDNHPYTPRGFTVSLFAQ
jgi:hypothetical protein